MKALFPDADITWTQQISAQPDEAVAKVAYSANGRASQANVLCHIANGEGIFFAIAAPTDLFAAKRPILIKVLTSLHAVASGQPATTSAPAAANGPLQYVPWKEPFEGAFTTEAPRGWKITGGLYRFAPVDVRPQIEVGSPDGAIHIQFGDAKLTAFAPPGPSSQLRGLSEGQSYAVNGITYTVLRYLNGAQASRMYVQVKLAKEHPGLEITGTRDLPELTEQANSKSAQSGLPIHHSVGETQFTYTENGKTVHGLCMTRTQLMGSVSTGMWSAYPNTVTATADRLEAARGVMMHMIERTVGNPQWDAEAQRTAQEFNQMVTVNHERAMAQIRQQWAKATAQMDENHRQWSNLINGQTDLVNPSTGQTFKADAGHTYYWQRGSTIVGTSTDWMPGINFSKLQQF
jgi:hypothetical protein